jgi:predicted Zn-dependent peptidase
MRIVTLVSTIVLLLATVVPVSAAGPQLAPFRKTTLDNGLTLLLMEQHEVPLISVQAVIRAGSVDDPAGREGVSLLTARLLRRGTAGRTADQVSEELDFIGASLDAGSDPDRSSVSCQFMNKDTAAALDVFIDILQHPSFPAAEVDKMVKQEMDGIKGDKEEAQSVLPRYFSGALMGSHPYARPVGGDEKSLPGIKRDDVAAFHETHYGPETTILAVVGDFVTADMERELKERLGKWTSRGRKATGTPAVPQPVKGRKLLLVNKGDTTQTYFALGNVGVARDNPDRTGIDLVNLLFGGRFTSMLNEALRINSGLTYGARSQFIRFRAPGLFIVSSYTPNATTTNAIDLALQTLQTLHRDGVSEDQLESAKSFFKGQFPPRIETSEQLAGVLADMEFYGLDKREITELFQRVDAFTTTDAGRVIEKYFPLDNLVFVLIGKADEIEASVKKYAPEITRREIEQPGFK